MEKIVKGLDQFPKDFFETKPDIPVFGDLKNWYLIDVPETDPKFVQLDGGMLAQVETESFWEDVGDFVLGTMECEVC